MDANPAFHMVALDTVNDDVPFSLAIELGATVREEPGDFEVTGDRFSSIRDPFGIRWTIMTRTVERTDTAIQVGLGCLAGIDARVTDDDPACPTTPVRRRVECRGES